MKATVKNKIAEMILDLMEAEAEDDIDGRDFDRDGDDSFGDVLDMLDDWGWESIIRQCSPTLPSWPNLPPAPRDTKNKIHVMIARETEANANYWLGENRAGQIWVSLDRDFALKALLLGHIPAPATANAE